MLRSLLHSRVSAHAWHLRHLSSKEQSQSVCVRIHSVSACRRNALVACDLIVTVIAVRSFATILTVAGIRGMTSARMLPWKQMLLPLITYAKTMLKKVACRLG